MILKLEIPPEMEGQRLDDTLSRLASLSKGESRRIIERGGCALNQVMVRIASRCVKVKDELTAGIMEQGRFTELVLPDDRIIYQDREILAVNKPSGVATQRTPYQLKGTLEYWVAEEFARQGIKEPVRVVHRLDRGTSGIVLFPKNRKAAAWLSELFSQKKMQKRYLALVSGSPESQSWQSDGSIGKVSTSRWWITAEGRSAVTDFRLLATADDLSLVEAYPRTGRTHQIRVHLAASGYPVIGDTTYRGVEAKRLMLHCIGLQFTWQNGSSFDLQALPDSDFITGCGRCVDGMTTF